MRVLLVEDEEAVVKEIVDLLVSRCNAEVAVARSRDSALDTLGNSEDYDLIVCDLRLPTSDGGLDLAEDHGFRVHDAARDRYPGTPCIFFSGFANLDNVGQRLAAGPSVDLLGTGEPWPIVDVRPKDKQPEFIARSVELAIGISQLDSLDLEISEEQSLIPHEARPLRIYARRLGGTRMTLSTLGGLSGAKVFRGEVFNESDSSIGLVVAKVGIVTEVTDEIGRYRQHVAPIIEIGAFAPLLDDVLYGGGRFGAAFYSLAEKWGQDLFQLAVSDPSTAAEAVARLQETLSVWGRSDAQSSISIGDLRSARARDDQIAPFTDHLDDMAWQEVESVTVQMRTSVQHGDLHGRNLLVDGAGNPLIIDYANVGPGPCVLDPVTLELSLLLHDEHPDLGGWPSREQASDWFDVERYVQGSPVDRLIRNCRGWATTVSGDTVELAAMVYAHSVRQLKYQDTNKELALTIAKAAADIILTSR